jgi:hypothetical protein
MKKKQLVGLAIDNSDNSYCATQNVDGNKCIRAKLIYTDGSVKELYRSKKFSEKRWMKRAKLRNEKPTEMFFAEQYKNGFASPSFRK